MVLAFRPGVPGSIPVQYLKCAVHLLICFFVKDFVRKRKHLQVTNMRGDRNLKEFADDKVNALRDLIFFF